MKYLPLFICLFTLILTPQTFAFEPDTTKPEAIPTIKIQNTYAFATMPGATTGAAFMAIENTGDISDKLIGARSKVAEITEIHQNMIDPDDGTMMMRKITNLDIAAQSKIILEPKGYHVMFIKMTEPLIMGENITVTLIFEKAGEIKTSISIVAPGLIPKEEKKMPWDNNDEDKKTITKKDVKEEAKSTIETKGEIENIEAISSEKTPTEPPEERIDY